MKTTSKFFIFLVIPTFILSIWAHGTLLAHADISLSHTYKEVNSCIFRDGVRKCSLQKIPLKILLSRKGKWMGEPQDMKSKKILEKIDRVEYTMLDERKIIKFGNGVMVIGADGEREMSWWVKDSIIF